jgi:hypothetical protein
LIFLQLNLFCITEENTAAVSAAHTAR